MPPSLHVVGAVILHRDRCLVAQRGPGMALAGKWEFPGGKVERGESARAALAREIAEELGLEVEVGDWIGRGSAIHDGQAVALDVYAASIVRGPLQLREHAQTRWVDASQLHSLDWAAADVPVLPAVHSLLSGIR